MASPQIDPKQAEKVLSISDQGAKTKKVARSLSISSGATAEESALDSLRSDKNISHAQELYRTDKDRFDKYRNYMKNHNEDLAREINSRNTDTIPQLIEWIHEKIGKIDNANALTKTELVEIAIVSAALTHCSEKTLSKKYDRGEMNALANIPLHSYNIRQPHRQKAYRDNSSSKYKEEKHVAHYIGLGFIQKMNENLPVEQRVGEEELKVILNHRNNLRMVEKNTNQSFHKKVDTLLEECAQGEIPQKISKDERNRMLQIVKRFQKNEFQQAMIDANGHHLYRSIRDCFKKFDIDDQQTLWDGRKDKRDLREVSTRDSKGRATTNTLVSASDSRKIDGTAPKTTPKRWVDAEGQTLYTGPRGGTYYVNSNGNKSYLKHGETTTRINTTPTTETTSRVETTSRSGTTPSGQTLYTGPRGGTYYVNSNGNKSYVK